MQKSGETVRVNVQLIKAADGSHLWADIFDRRLTDILSVESEVSKAIADQLRVKLTGQEEQIIAAKPTDNTAAYDAYLRGLAYELKNDSHRPTLLAHVIISGKRFAWIQGSRWPGLDFHMWILATTAREIFNQPSACAKRPGRQPRPHSPFSPIWGRRSMPKASIITPVYRIRHGGALL